MVLNKIGQETMMSCDKRNLEGTYVRTSRPEVSVEIHLFDTFYKHFVWLTNGVNLGSFWNDLTVLIFD